MSDYKTFVEIGTCDFDTCADFTNSGKWRGVMCEPTPHLMSSVLTSLKTDYNIRTDQIAITDYDGFIDFATTKEANNDWSRGVGTVINPNHTGTCLYNINKNAELLYDKIQRVPCMSLDSLMNKHYAFLNHGKLDYLKIDTEGHELTILQAYSWQVKPTFIKVENKHINHHTLKALLERQGYRVYTEKEDTYAIYSGVQNA